MKKRAVFALTLATAFTSIYGYVAPRIPQQYYGVPLQSSSSSSSSSNRPLNIYESQFGSSSSSQSLSNSISSSFQSSNQGLSYQKPEIFKHIYVHVAPEDKQEQMYRQELPLPPPRKHYKIIFIKTPEPPAPVPPQILQQQLNEEKTLVYVLLKQQDAVEDFVLPTAAPTEPNKPEVYFIKYKGNKESTSGSSSSGSINEASSSSSSSSMASHTDANMGTYSEGNAGFISGSTSSSSSSSNSVNSVSGSDSSSIHKPADSYGPPRYY